jgi:hypothetical protein
MSKASVRNAPVAALIYEFLYNVYAMIDVNRSYLSGLSDEKAAPFGVFDHRFTSKWEWSASILLEVGAILPLNAQRRMFATPYYTPVMTLEACQASDFSAFETFDNYCYAMFTLDHHVSWYDDELPFTSPRFLDAVAAKDNVLRSTHFLGRLTTETVSTKRS